MLSESASLPCMAVAKLEGEYIPQVMLSESASMPCVAVAKLDGDDPPHMLM